MGRGFGRFGGGGGRSQPLIPNTIVASRGSFVLTGQDVGLYYGRSPLPAAVGSFALSGQSAALTVQRVLSASAGAVSLSGQDVGLTAQRLLSAGQGSFVLGGQDVTLTYTSSGTSYTLTASQGSLALTGQSANLLKGSVLTAAQGTFTLTGDSMTPTINYILPSAQGSFGLTGQSANLLRSYSATAAQGSFALSGQAANLLRGYPLTAAQGSFALSGQSANLVYSGGAPYTLTASQGSISLSGQSVGLLKGSVVTAAQGSFALSGQAVTLTYTGGGGDAAWTTAFIARTSGLSTPQSNAVKTFMNALATAGLDAKCEVAHILALPSTNALLNIKSSSYTATNHSATQSSSGYAGNGTSAYIDSGFAPSSNMAIGSRASFSIYYVQTAMDYDNAACVAIDSSNAHTVMTSLDFGSSMAVNPASGTQVSWSNTDTTGSVGRFGMSRTSTTAVAIYHNGSSVATSSSNTADATFDGGNLVYLGGPTISGLYGYAAQTLGFVGMFSGLNSTEQATLDTACYAMLHSLNSTAYP